MAIAYISLVSNVGDRIKMIRQALALVKSHEQTTLEQLSSFYESEPLEYPNQSWAIAAVAKLETELTPIELLQALNAIEAAMQAEKNIRWGPRTIDLDLLLYDLQVIDRPGLQVPHIRLHDRAHVLTPLNELAPDIVHPTLDKTPAQLLDMLSRPTQVKKLESDLASATP